MIRLAIRSLLLALPLAGLISAAQAASTASPNAAPALRATVTVTGELVRIGDLVENAGAAADVPIFRAPDLGTLGVVPTERIIEAIRPHQLIDIDTRGLSEVIVTRVSRSITAQEIADRIAKAMESQYGLGEARNIQVEFDRDVRTINVEQSAGGELQITSLSYSPRSTRFDATLDLPSSAAVHWRSMRFTGTAIETVEAVSVDHAVERGEVLKASDLTIIRRPKSEGSVLTDPHSVAGLAAKHELRPGQALHEADLMKPAIVQRNDPVTIIYEAPGLTLTLRGQAQDAGALGDTIGVLNAQSKRIVQGVIAGPGRVAVNITPARVVQSDPASTSAIPSSNQPQRERNIE